MFFHHATTKVDHQANHAFDGAADHVRKEKIVGETFLSHRPGLGVVEDDRRVGFFQFIKDRIEVWVPPFFARDRRRLDVQRLAAEFARAMEFLDRFF